MRVFTAGRCSANHLPQLLHEDVGVVEQAVDEIDGLAVERDRRGADACRRTFGDSREDRER
jgi:hypothetical protein